MCPRQLQVNHWLREHLFVGGFIFVVYCYFIKKYLNVRHDICSHVSSLVNVIYFGLLFGIIMFISIYWVESSMLLCELLCMNIGFLGFI